MMRGVLPSIKATALLVVPRSIPMTEPFTFSPEPSAYPRTNDEPKGDRMAGARWTAEAARGRKVRDILEDNMVAGMCGGSAAEEDASNREMERGGGRNGWMMVVVDEILRSSSTGEMMKEISRRRTDPTRERPKIRRRPAWTGQSERRMVSEFPATVAMTHY